MTFYIVNNGTRERYSIQISLAYAKDEPMVQAERFAVKESPITTGSRKIQIIGSLFLDTQSHCISKNGEQITLKALGNPCVPSADESA